MHVSYRQVFQVDLYPCTCALYLHNNCYFWDQLFDGYYFLNNLSYQLHNVTISLQTYNWWVGVLGVWFLLYVLSVWHSTDAIA